MSPNPHPDDERARAFFRTLRRVADGRLADDEDGAALEPELIEDGLASLSGPRSHSLADALSLVEADTSSIETGIEKLQDYVARYLHTSYEETDSWQWQKLVEKVESVTDMVRAENGKPPRGTVDLNQTFT